MTGRLAAAVTDYLEALDRTRAPVNPTGGPDASAAHGRALRILDAAEEQLREAVTPHAGADPRIVGTAIERDGHVIGHLVGRTDRPARRWVCMWGGCTAHAWEVDAHDAHEALHRHHLGRHVAAEVPA